MRKVRNLLGAMLNTTKLRFSVLNIGGNHGLHSETS